MTSRRLVLPVAVSGGWLAWGLINVINRGQMYLADGSAAPWRHLFITELASTLLWIPTTLAAVWLAGRFPLGPSGWSGVFAHLAGLATTIAGRALIVAGLNDRIGWYAETVPPLDELLLISVYNNLFMYALITLAAHALYYARAHREQQQQLEQARREMLRAQLQPHFLFNALNTIAAVVHADPHGAERMIVGLGDLLRHSLDNDRRTTVPLGEELALLRAYLDIEQERFADRLAVRWEVDPRTLAAAVPPLLLQPLAENAVRHGLWPSPGGGELRIVAAREGTQLVLQVCDDGLGLRPDASYGVGLSNTTERLRGLYGRQHQFGLAARTGGGVTTTVKLPYRDVGTGSSDR